MQLLNIDKILKKSPALGEIPSTKEIFSRTVQIAGPSVAESFFVALVGMIDTMMVGVLGTEAIAAVGLTNQPKLAALSIFMSISTAISAVVARRTGEKRQDSANQLLMQVLMIAMGIAVAVTAVGIVFADPIMRFCGSQPDTHEMAVRYFRIIMAGVILNSIFLTINAAHRGSGHTKITMRTNIVANAVNVVFNFLLIEGRFGFPALGVDGAAFATVIGMAVATVMSILSLFRHNGFITWSKMKLRKFTQENARAFFGVGSSALCEQLFLRIGFILFAAIVAHLGTNAFAAHQIGMNFMSITFSFGDGLAAASVALVGQSLGQKRSDLAKIYGSACQRLGFCISCFFAVLFLTVGRYFFLLYTDEPIVLNYGVQIMQMLVFIQFFQVSQVIYSGCLRGAGDNKFTAFSSLVGTTIVRPSLSYVLCYTAGLGLIGAWLGIIMDQVLRLLFSMLRFRSGKWTKLKL